MRKWDKYVDITIRNMKTGEIFTNLTIDTLVEKLGLTRKYGVGICWRGKYKDWMITSRPVDDQRFKITHEQWHNGLEKRKKHHLVNSNMFKSTWEALD